MRKKYVSQNEFTFDNFSGQNFLIGSINATNFLLELFETKATNEVKMGESSLKRISWPSSGRPC